MKRYVLALDLIPDPEKIAAYEKWHTGVWPEIKTSIQDAGVQHMQIYRFSNRLMMIMEVDDTFSFRQKAEADAQDPKVQEWEALMSIYQQQIPGTKAGEKWVLMDKIFDLK